MPLKRPWNTACAAWTSTSKDRGPAGRRRASLAPAPARSPIFLQRCGSGGHGGADGGALFIDEGFGSLDQDALDIAISSLDALQSMGRRVGVISHVQTLVERIGTRVTVQPAGGGKSTVSTVAV